MPTLIVENVPADVYESLQRRATADHRTLSDELLHLLQRVLQPTDEPSPRLPEYIASEEIMAPYDLPRSSQPVPVKTHCGRTANTLPNILR